MDTNTAIEIHLSKRPIARILNQSNENNDSIALRLMCIIDYYMEERHLYSRIAKTQCPKLLVQLLKFHTFVSFKYYDYRASRKVGDNVLRCKFCDLVGPYTYILTHMAINHNAHIGLKMCAYCNREELKTHFNNETFDKCYNHYLQRHVVTRDDEIFEIVASFYALIKEISEKLNVCTVRNHAYAGTGYTAIEKIAHKYGRDFPTDCIIFQQRNFEKPIRDETLQKEFVRVISFMYGGNHISRLMRKIETRTDENVIVISDDDDDDSTHDEFDSPIRSHGELRAPATNDSNFHISPPHYANEVIYKSVDELMPENLVKREIQISSTGLPSITSSPAYSMATTSTRSWTNESDTEHFGIFVAQRLQKLPDDIKRRKLEIQIQEAIVQAEKESLE